MKTISNILTKWKLDALSVAGVDVDKNDDGTGTMARSRKKSFAWYQQVISSNGEKL